MTQKSQSKDMLAGNIINIKVYLTVKESKEMVNSVSSVSTSSVQSTNTNAVSEEEQNKKTEEEKLFPEQDKQKPVNNPSSTITEDTAKTEAQSYINTLKAQYPQLAAKLDSYYSNLDFETLCAEAASTTDIRAYIYSETQGFLR